MIVLMSDPRQIQVKLSAEAFEAIERECRRTGMTKIELLSRVVTWYARQDDVIRGAVVGTLPASIAPDVARVLLEKLAEGKKRAS